MQLGMIGLGRIRANIVWRLQRAGHECVVFDRNPASVNQLAGEGATGAASLDDFVEKLSRPRAAGPNTEPCTERQSLLPTETEVLR